jgi:sulfur carrier protein ThiS adenylyltransferase
MDDARHDGDAESADRPMPQAELRTRLAPKTVAILGCGGLGSNCAVMLVRAGVGSLTLVDYDDVEAENLNRQMFFADQIGQPKVDALAETLRRIEPSISLRLVRECIEPGTIREMVEGADVIVEAVDSAEAKAMILSLCPRVAPDVPVVSASGLAGCGSANEIETVQLAQDTWVAGDLESDIREGHALVASRVMVAAAHEAHAAIRILLGFPGA